MDRLERLVNLVAALIDTTQPLTRGEIRDRIDGYSEDNEAFRRNFERDKELLRQMGFPLVTVPVDPTRPDDLGYRIPRELYELPDPGLDESELAALRLAASAVQLQGEWDEDVVVRALRKLGGAVTDGPDGDQAASGGGVLAGLAELPGGDAVATAFAAVAERRQVSFSYRGKARVIDPWRLSFHRGHWYLSGLDHTRGGAGEERMFRLDRLEGPLLAQGPPAAYARPSLTQASPPPAWRLGDEDEIKAELFVDAEQARWARQALGEGAVRSVGGDGSVVFEVGVTNRAAFRSFVLGFLDHAEVLGPSELRADMISWLGALAGPMAGGQK
ncbi:MAG TPA: WYL domain-containing protein [Acidimicrobiales bacterium]|nr:WYL domain-containing protein [Acidimicrobiales bacterium]